MNTFKKANTFIGATTTQISVLITNLNKRNNIYIFPASTNTDTVIFDYATPTTPILTAGNGVVLGEGLALPVGAFYSSTLYLSDDLVASGVLFYFLAASGTQKVTLTWEPLV